ncbi:hypothetical protein [Sphaerospermopsis sp. FACHB-1094]|nr:hypothetical protein [Sphaerospermopsis sp. FACHB-1094]
MRSLFGYVGKVRSLFGGCGGSALAKLTEGIAVWGMWKVRSLF